MAKYIIPSVSISAFFSSYYNGLWPPREPPKIASLPEAIRFLNENRRSLDAINYILKADTEESVRLLGQMSTRSIGALASHGWAGVHAVPIAPFDAAAAADAEDDDDVVFERLLTRMDLGDDFRALVAWLGRVPCEEAEEYGGPRSGSHMDAWLGGPRPSQTARLQQILQMLFLKTEAGTIPECSSVLRFLHGMFTQYYPDPETRSIALLALKTLANIAASNPEHAAAILKSEWLPLLADLAVNGKRLAERLLAHKIFRNALYSLGMIDYVLRSDVYELHVPKEKPPLVDIILIHGLRGSVAYTWRQRDYATQLVTECWPKDWLPLDISDPIRIIGIDYPSYLLQFSGTMESLQVRADRFARQLADAGVGSRPVLFICHSMGGLLAKKLCVDLPELAAQTVGILFIATPHKGSPIASRWGFDAFSVSEDVRFLRESNELNLKLDADFRECAVNWIPVLASIVETRESSFFGATRALIVPSASAVFGRGTVYHIEDVHHNVCKPSERTSPVYGVVLNFVRDSIEEARKRLT